MKRKIVPKRHGIVYCVVFFVFISIPVFCVSGNGHVPADVSSISFNSISYTILMFILFLIVETESQYVTRLFLVNATSTGNEKKNQIYFIKCNRIVTIFVLQQMSFIFMNRIHFLFSSIFLFKLKSFTVQFTFKRKLTNLVSIRTQPTASNQNRR